MYTMAQLNRLKILLRGQKVKRVLNSILWYSYLVAWIVAILGVAYVTILSKLMGV